MSYRLNNTGQEVQTVIDEMQSRTPHATKQKPGFMGADDKTLIEALQEAVIIINDLLPTKAPLDSPALTGAPTAPRPSENAQGTEIVTAEWAKALVTACKGVLPDVPVSVNNMKEGVLYYSHGDLYMPMVDSTESFYYYYHITTDGIWTVQKDGETETRTKIAINLNDISGVLDGSDITVAEMQVGKVYLKEGTLQIKNAPGSGGRFAVTVFSPDGIFSHVYVNGTKTIHKITADNDKVPVYLADIDEKTPDELRELVPLDETKSFYDGTATYVIFRDDASAIEKTTYGNGFIFYSRATESEWDEEQWTEIGIDHELSEESERAVANKVIKAEFDALRDYIDKATNEFIVLEDGFPLMLEDQKYVYPKLNT